MGKARFADVWLVRAGCTQWDQEGRIVGATDLPTCQAGIDSARVCAKTLANHAVSTVVSAECEAAQTTARMISEATEARIKVLPDLGEIGLGLWEGLLECDIEGRCPTAYRQWKTDPSSVNPPEGEAFGDAMARVAGTLEHAISKYVKPGQGLAIVVGPTVFALIKCWLEQRPAADLWALAEGDSAVERLCVDCVTMKSLSTGAATGEPAAGRKGEKGRTASPRPASAMANSRR
ncbi:MAG: histidine phosphatase family protein [Phycisphaerales bacterium]|nr:histidine phosphatase family protein [Phycisphaerales bacterium]